MKLKHFKIYSKFNYIEVNRENEDKVIDLILKIIGEKRTTEDKD